jgi:GNAT superfamily N-acetyltransferase
MIKQLHGGSVSPSDTDAVTVRTYADSADVDRWLALQHRAFPREARKWNHAEFVREFLSKPWWRPECLWLAEPTEGSRVSQQGLPPGDATECPLVGSVGLMPHPHEPGAACVHWLMVDPAWQRRGVGMQLLTYVESACHQFGYRELHAETLAQWQSAVRFYRAAGFRPLTNS